MELTSGRFGDKNTNCFERCGVFDGMRRFSPGTRWLSKPGKRRIAMGGWRWSLTFTGI